MRVMQRRRIVSPGFEQLNQPFEGLRVQQAKALSFGKDPFVVETGEEVALVAVRGFLQGLYFGTRVGSLPCLFGLCQKLLEVGDIEDERRVAPPAQRSGIRLEESTGIRKRVAQAMEEVA